MNGYNLIPSDSTVSLSNTSCLIIYDVRIDGFSSRKIKQPDPSKYQFRVHVYDIFYKKEPSYIEVRGDKFIFKLTIESGIFDKLTTIHMMKSLVKNIIVIESTLKDEFIQRQIIDSWFHF
jgi:hypothetical protein